MATPTTIKIAFENASALPATLVSSSYEGAPLTIGTAEEKVGCKQDITFENLLRTIVYDLGNKIKWIISWTTDFKVSTKIIRADVPIIWKDMLDKLQANASYDKLLLDEEETSYEGSAEIYSTPEDPLFMLAMIMVGSEKK